MDTISTQELIDRILRADVEEINPILDAITQRFTEVWPDWELMTISVAGHDGEACMAALQKTMDFIQRIEK